MGKTDFGNFTTVVYGGHGDSGLKEGELSPESVCAKFAHTAPDGKVYQVAFYNLDVVNENDSIQLRVKRYF